MGSATQLGALLAMALTATACTPAQPEGPSDREIVDRFAQIWNDSPETWRRNFWFGIPTLQNPFDVWVTQEIIWEVQPEVIVEAGTFMGGSAALWATLLQQVDPEGRVITIDIENKSGKARRLPTVKERVDFLIGSSTDPAIVERVKELVAGRRALAILDSLHTKDHVLAELRAYAPLVPVGSYIVVQDGAVNGHPILPDWGPGPYEAVEAFLGGTEDFEVDRSRERLMMTFNPLGFLKRVK